MVTDRFVQRVLSQQCTYSVAAVLCLLVGSIAGCTGKKGATITVVEASVSNSGTITLWVRTEKGSGAYKYTELLKTGTTELELGEVVSIGHGGMGEFVNTFRTADPSSVQFLVQEGQSVFVATGQELDLLQFAPRDEKESVVTRYTIRIRKAVSLE